MFSDVAKEIEEAERGDPVGIVNEAGGIGGRIEVEKTGELGLDAGDVVRELFSREQVAFGRATRGIADHAGGAAGEGDDMVPGALESRERELAHEVADVQRVAGGIEAAIDRDGAFAQALGERVKVGAVGEESAPLEVFDQGHCCRKCES